MSQLNVLHCGGEEEMRFLEYLEKSVGQSAGKFTLEYTKFQPRQAKDILTYNDALKYKKEKLPMIVLITKSFFDLIWLTSLKQGIINVITNYSTKNCLHIWIDVNEDYVKYRSTALCRTDGYFRRIKATDLTTKLSSTDVSNKMQELINVNGDGKFDPLNNYAVDDEEEEMCKNFQRETFGMVSQPPSVPERQTKVRAKKNNNDVYKNALRMASMTAEELEASGLLNGGGESSVQNTQSNKKKKKKKKGDTESIKLLTDISERDKKQIANYLDKGAGANWKQLAETFNVSSAVIRKLTDSPTSQTEKLIDTLIEIQPNLQVSEFMQKCKLIMRSDVQRYIQNNILN